MQDVLITIHANIRDLEEKRTFADPEEHDYIDGRLFSYTVRRCGRDAGHSAPVGPRHRP